MAINFTTKSAPFVKESLSLAFRQYYPDDPLKELKMTHLIKAIKKFAKELVSTKEFCVGIRRKSIDLTYADLPYIAAVSKKVKLIGFMRDRISIVYFYPRGQLKGREKEIVNAIRKVFQVTRLKKKVYNYRVVNLMTSKLKKENSDPFAEHFSHIVELQQHHQSVFLPIYHALNKTGGPKENSYEKFHLFVEGFETDLLDYRTELFSKGKKNISKEVIAWCCSMVEAVKNVHEEKIYHGWITLSAFHVKAPAADKVLGLFPSGFSVALKHKSDQVVCRGKPPLLLGYESIQQMIKEHTCDEAKEGLPGDVWMLGCALHQLVLGDYPPFALFASLAPQLNAGCMRLQKKINEQSDREMAKVDMHELVRAPSIPLKVSLKEIRDDWKRSKETAPPQIEKHFLTKEPAFRLSNSLRDDLNRLELLVQQAHSALAHIELEELGILSESRIMGKVKSLQDIVMSLTSGIFDRLLVEDNVTIQRDLSEKYRHVCSQVIGFNRLFLKELEQAEQILSNMRENSDPLINIIQKMLQTDPGKRITAKKAFSILKKL